MKGTDMPESIFITLLFLVIISTMIIVAYIIYLQINFPFFSTRDPVSYSVEFVRIADKSFLLAEVISNVQLGDRQMLEQSIESVAVDSLENAGATDLEGNIKEFADMYGLKSYHVSISGDIADVQNTEFMCGDNMDGWCVANGCDVGRIEIAQGKNKCTSVWQKCCKEDEREYARTGQYAIVHCGAKSEGICSEGQKPFPFSKPVCTQNRIDLGTASVCSNANSGKTPVCCAPKTGNSVVTQSGLVLSRAIVPLLYKNTAGILEVDAS